jgi:hypothetical protein
MMQGLKDVNFNGYGYAQCKRVSGPGSFLPVRGGLTKREILYIFSHPLFPAEKPPRLMFQT